jgi:hypothetical protein
VVGTRRGSLLDLGWDLAGAGLSALLILAWRRPKTAPIKG